MSKLVADVVVESLFYYNWSEITNTQVFPCEYLNKHQIPLVFFLSYFSPLDKPKAKSRGCFVFSVYSTANCYSHRVPNERMFLMDLLYLFFLSNITVCLLMLLVSFQGLYQLSRLQYGIQRVFKLAVNVLLGGQEKSIVALWSTLEVDLLS